MGFVGLWIASLFPVWHYAAFLLAELLVWDLLVSGYRVLASERRLHSHYATS